MDGRSQRTIEGKAMQAEKPVNCKIAAYKIISADRAAVLAAKVSDEIDNGWQPLGGVAVTRTPDRGNDFYQAVVILEG